MSKFLNRLQVYQRSVESALDYWLPAPTIKPEVLHEAMRYSVLGNGKRIRPILLYATGEAFGVSISALDGVACAVEIIHAYSLIHDDLPSMDNDNLRRGQPTCHCAYDEATAILAGDALQAMAFHIIASDPKIEVNDRQRLAMIKTLTTASGSQGMAGGQAIDLGAVGKSLDIVDLEGIHTHKTGALICASAELGALSANNVTDGDELFLRISEYGRYIGLAFQIRDDIIDIESDTETLGKTQGADIAMDKPTYPNLLGLAGAKEAANDLYNEAIECLHCFDQRADMLRWVADYIINRNH